MPLPDQLTPTEVAELTQGYDQAAADVSALLTRDKLTRWLDEEGPVIATSRLTSLLHEQMSGAGAAVVAAHCAVRLLMRARQETSRLLDDDETVATLACHLPARSTVVQAPEWTTRQIAIFQAEHLARAGYRLTQTTKEH